MGEIGKGLIVIGLILAAVGALCVLASRLPWLGRLPGDVSIHRGSWTLYVPLGTCLVISVALSLILWLWGRR